MNARTLIIVLVALAIGAVGGVLGYTWLVGGSGEPSGETTAPTLDINALPTLNPTQSFAALTQVAELESEVADLEATIDSFDVAESGDAESAATPEPAADDDSAGRVQFRIDAENSEATFTLEEDLRGVRTTVIGRTSEVAGDIIIDFDNPATSQIGTIRINARTLSTDNEFRNRALRAEILLSSQDQYEFIEFVPTALNGLPDSVTVGETYAFDIVGDLTIIGVTNEVTFTTEVTIDSETAISGTATTSVLYADWGITIPDVQSVANITDDVTLAITFEAGQVE